MSRFEKPYAWYSAYTYGPCSQSPAVSSRYAVRNVSSKRAAAALRDAAPRGVAAGSGRSASSARSSTPSLAALRDRTAYVTSAVHTRHTRKI